MGLLQELLGPPEAGSSSPHVSCGERQRTALGRQGTHGASTGLLLPRGPVGSLAWLDLQLLRPVLPVHHPLAQSALYASADCSTHSCSSTFRQSALTARSAREGENQSQGKRPIPTGPLPSAPLLMLTRSVGSLASGTEVPPCVHLPRL